jgi:hypothetical protein
MLGRYGERCIGLASLPFSCRITYPGSGYAEPCRLRLWGEAPVHAGSRGRERQFRTRGADQVRRGGRINGSQLFAKDVRVADHLIVVVRGGGRLI